MVIILGVSGLILGVWVQSSDIRKELVANSFEASWGSSGSDQDASL